MVKDDGVGLVLMCFDVATFIVAPAGDLLFNTSD